MTVETLNSRNSFEGNGTTTQFSCTFPAIKNNDVLVTLEGVPQTENVDYVIVGNVQDPPWIIDFVTAPALDLTIVAQRSTDINQQTIYQPFGRYLAKQHEGDFDKGILIDQELAQAALFDALRLIPGTELFDARTFNITRLKTPVNPDHAATKGYVDQVAGEGVDPDNPTVFATLTVLGKQVAIHLQDWLEPLQSGGPRGLGLLQIPGFGPGDFMEQIVFVPINNGVRVTDNVFGYDFLQGRWETRGFWHFADGMTLENNTALRGDNTTQPNPIQIPLAKVNVDNETEFGDAAVPMVLNAFAGDIFVDDGVNRGTVWHQLNLPNPVSADADEIISGNWRFTNPVDIFVQNESGLYVGTGVDGTSAAMEFRGEEFWKFQAETNGDFTLYAQGPLGVDGENFPAFAVARDLGIRIFNTMAMADGDIIFQDNDSYIQMTDFALGQPTRVFGLDTDNILHIGAADFPIEAVEIGNSTGSIMRLTDELVTVGIPSTKPVDLLLANTAALQIADDVGNVRDVVTVTSGNVFEVGSANFPATLQGQFVQINTFGQATAIFDQNGLLSMVREGVRIPNNVAYQSFDIGATPRDLIRLDLTDTVIIGDTDIAEGKIELFSTDFINRFDGAVNWQMWDTEALPNPVDGANLIISSDSAMIEIIDPELATNTTLEIQSDVAFGIPKLTGAGLIRADQLPITALTFLGTWSPTTDGSTPPADGVSSLGEFYIFNEAGNMTLFEESNQTPHTVAVDAGDVMLFDDGTGSGNVAGWYFIASSFPTAIPATNVTYDNSFSDWTNTDVQGVLDEISDRATLEDRVQTITAAWRFEGIPTFAGTSSALQTVAQLGQIAGSPGIPLVRLRTDDAINRLTFQHFNVSADMLFTRDDGANSFARLGGTPTASFFDLGHPTVNNFFAFRMLFDTNEMKLLVGDPLGVLAPLQDFMVWDGVTMVIADVNFPTTINSTFTRIVHGGTNTLFDSTGDIFPARNLVFSNNDSINWLDNVAAQQTLLVFNAANQFGVGNIAFLTALQGSSVSITATTAGWDFAASGLLTAAGSIQIPNAAAYNTLTLGGTPRNLLFMDAADRVFIGTSTEDATLRALVQLEILVGSQNYLFSNGGTATFNQLLILQDPGAVEVGMQMNNSVRNWALRNVVDGTLAITDNIAAQNRFLFRPFAESTGLEMLADRLIFANVGTLNGNIFFRIQNDLAFWDLLIQGTSANRFVLTDNTGAIPLRIDNGMASFLDLGNGIMQWNNPTVSGNPSFRISNGDGQTWLFQALSSGNLQIWELGAGVPLELVFGHASKLLIADGVTSFNPGFFDAIGSSVAFRHTTNWEFGTDAGGGVAGVGHYLFNTLGANYIFRVNGALNHLHINPVLGNVAIGHADVPTVKLDIRGPTATVPRMRFGVSGVGTDSLLMGLLGGNEGFIQINNAAGGTNTTFRGDAGAAWVNGLTAGFFGVGTVSPTQRLHVAGNVLVDIAGAPSLGNITNVFRLDVVGNAIRVLNAANALADFNCAILTASSINVSGVATLAGLIVNGATQLNGTLGVTGVSSLAATNISTTLGVVGVSSLAATNISTTLGVSGLTTLTGLTNNGVAQINGTLGVTGLSTLAGANITAGATLVALSTYKGVEIATLADIPPASGTTVTRFTSAEFLASNTSGSVAHGLGRLPDGFYAVLRCVIAANTYLVGDEILLEGIRINNDFAGHGWANATTVGYAFSNPIAQIAGKAGVNQNIVLGSWRVVMRAWIYTP